MIGVGFDRLNLDWLSLSKPTPTAPQMQAGWSRFWLISLTEECRRQMPLHNSPRTVLKRLERPLAPAGLLINRINNGGETRAQHIAIVMGEIVEFLI